MPSRTFRPPKGPCQLHLRTLVINIFPFQKLQKTESHCLVALDSKHLKKKFNDLKQGMPSSIPQRFHHFQRFYLHYHTLQNTCLAPVDICATTVHMYTGAQKKGEMAEQEHRGLTSSYKCSNNNVVDG